MKRILFLLAFFISLHSVSYAATIIDDDMDSYVDKTAAMASANWPDALDGDITLESGAECRGGSGKCWKMEWSAGDTLQYASLPINLPEVYIRFYFKQGNMLDKGSKVLKLHGSQAGTGYSNTTFSQAYASGIWRELSSGDGTATENDSTSLGRYTLSSASQFPGSTVATYTAGWTGYEVVDGNWHCIEVYERMNTHTGTTLNNDGEYSVWVDGVLIYNLTNVNMRHYLNTREIANAAFGVYTSEAGLIQYYDDFVIADTYIGPVGAESDVTAPTITGFVIPATSSSLTVPISTFTATDDTAVTNYCLVETDSSAGCSWSGTAQTSYAFATQGAKTLYAFARDAASNVSSSANDSVTITLAQVSPGTTSSSIGKGITGSSIGKSWTVGE